MTAEALRSLAPRVDFVVGGVQKGGTTSLDRLLRTHPAVAMARSKEPHWFDQDALFAAGDPDPAPYHGQWGDALAQRLCGDATPSYVWWPGAIERIHAYHPGMKWIVLLRDPVERAYSHWNMQRERGREPLAFDEALDAEPLRMASGDPTAQRRHSYASRGFYARQLAALGSRFPRDQVLVLLSEDLRGRASATAAAVTDFLGLDPLASVPEVSANEGDYATPMQASDRTRLVALYRADVTELERLLGRSLAHWLA